MSMPQNNNPSSSSPARAIRIDLAHPHPSRQGSDDREHGAPGPRRSPTLVRTPDPNDPVAQERQRSLDADSALQLSRARSGSVFAAAHQHQHQHPHSHSHPHHQIQQVQGQQLMDDVAGGERDGSGSPLGSRPGSSSGLSVTNGTGGYPFSMSPTDEVDQELSGMGMGIGGRGSGNSSNDMFAQHLSQAHDPSLLVSLSMPDVGAASGTVSGESLLGALPVYQARPSLLGSLAGAVHSQFDFGLMEAYAVDEKRKLGIVSRSASGGSGSQAPAPAHGLRWASSTLSSPPPNFSSPLLQNSHSEGAVPADAAGVDAASVAGEGHRDFSAGTINPPPSHETLVVEPAQSKDVSPDSSSARLRQRKLSLSNTVRPRSRRVGAGKMAFFEGTHGAPPPTFGTPGVTKKGRFSPMSSYEQFPQVGNGEASSPNPLPPPIYGSVGHERPYRFSFYSNALSATIHSRSLSELPAEGQTFENLFFGRDRCCETNDGMDKSKPGDSSKPSVLSQEDEVSAWWLDVLSPTDEEMKLLSKVFGIHPLTTEDIQMEETREKIELFRNYYLVSFRSFDQDPYSPTYLEPLNMYILVFREGTLSFHFRSTNHPQNVRRRIKQMKDYVSVTSDWISYALIDDITDAFAPLIQNIEYEVDSIDELVLILKEAEQSDMLRRIGACRKKVMGLLRLMGNKADVVKGLAKRCNENWNIAPKSDIGLYLSDIQDHLITMTQNLNHYEKILSRSHSNYLAQISIEMTDANNQINDVLSKLTALGTVLIPMNLVTGLWGMNVHVPGQDAPGYAWFLSIIGGLVGFALIGGFLTYKLMRR